MLFRSSTGKTTLTNALLAEVAKTSDRVVLIEDTRELQCRAPNLVALRTKDGVASLSDLVRSSLRLRPDRIPIEMRSEDELHFQTGRGAGGKLSRVKITPKGSRASNPAFDVTPARYIAGIITEKGIVSPTREALQKVKQ